MVRPEPCGCPCCTRTTWVISVSPIARRGQTNNEHCPPQASRAACLAATIFGSPTVPSANKNVLGCRPRVGGLGPSATVRVIGSVSIPLPGGSAPFAGRRPGCWATPAGAGGGWSSLDPGRNTFRQARGPIHSQDAFSAEGGVRHRLRGAGQLLLGRSSMGVAPHVRTVVGCPSFIPSFDRWVAVADMSRVGIFSENPSALNSLEFNNVTTLVFHNCGQVNVRRGKSKHAP